MQNWGWEIGRWRRQLGPAARERRGSGRKHWMCRYVAEGEKKKGTQKNKVNPIPRKLQKHFHRGWTINDFLQLKLFTSRAITAQELRQTSFPLSANYCQARPLNLACFYHLLLFLLKTPVPFKPLSTNSLWVAHAVCYLLHHTQERWNDNQGHKTISLSFLFPLPWPMYLKKKTK